MSRHIGNKSKEIIISNIIQMCFVDHDFLTNYLGNSETCQDDNIAMLFTNVVFISCAKTMLLAFS
jgi:hypothetical protein